MKTEPFEEDICANRHGGNPESVAAGNAYDVRSKMRDHHWILHWLKEEGPSTCDEMEAGLGLSHQTCSARCSELKRKGLIKPKPVPGDPTRYEKAPTRTGSLAAVLVLV
jgi:predicted HTH transcriptional regulator